MPTRNVFRWPEGRGWLILSGGGDSASDVRAMALTRAAADGAVACVSLGAGAAESVLEDMEDLGAPAGYLVDVTAEDDETIRARLADAGVIVIESAEGGVESRSGLLGAAVEGIRTAYEAGAVILAEGYSAMAFGAWVVAHDGRLAEGLEWVEGALVAPGVTDAGAWAREILLAQPLAFAVGIGFGSALALGPDGQLEAWGGGEITIALGRDYTSGPPAQG